MEETFAAGLTLSVEEGEEREALEVVLAGFNCDLKLIVGVACGFDGSALGEGVVLDKLALFFNISAIIGFALVGIGAEIALPDDPEGPPEDDPDDEGGAETSAAERSFFCDSGTFFNFPPFLISVNRSALPLGMAAGGGSPDAGGGGGGGPGGGGGGGGADMCFVLLVRMRDCCRQMMMSPDFDS